MSTNTYRKQTILPSKKSYYGYKNVTACDLVCPFMVVDTDKKKAKSENFRAPSETEACDFLSTHSGG